MPCVSRLAPPVGHPAFRPCAFVVRFVGAVLVVFASALLSFRVVLVLLLSFTIVREESDQERSHIEIRGEGRERDGKTRPRARAR